MAGLRRILVASDFSKPSRKAFATAVAMAKANHASMTIVHVIVPISPIVPEQYLNAQTWETIDSQTRRWSQQQLDRLTRSAKKAGVRAVALVRDGDPAREIVKIARSKRADIVVVGTNGRTGLAKFFVGSIAARVVATASCPVVTVRG